jgi:hypothetical protein
VQGDEIFAHSTGQFPPLSPIMRSGRKERIGGIGQKLAIDRTLRDAIVLLRRDWSLTLSIAAVFCFLPPFVYFGFIPASAMGGDTAVPEGRALFDLFVGGIIVPMIVLNAFAFLGSVMIIRIWFQPPGALVGDAVGYGLALAPVAILTHLLVSAASIAGFMLLIVPGLYIVCRTALILPALADQPFVSPVAAWRDGWSLSDGRAVPLLVLVLMVGMLSVALAVALALVDGSLAAEAPAAPNPLAGLSNGLVALISAMLTSAVMAAAYRQLRVADAGEIFS